MNQEPKNEVQNKIDPKTIQPEVLGHLRTEKIGNPSMLIAFLAIIVIVLLILPLSTSMLQNPNSFLFKLIYKQTDVVIDEDKVKSDFDDGSKPSVLNATSNIKFGNLILQNFSLSSGKVECDIKSYSGILDLDNDSIYMNIYSSSDETNLIGYIKLTGKDYDSNITRKTFENSKLSFNSRITYYGKLFKLESESDYPSFSVNEDGTLICKKNNREIEYIFDNNYLIGIKDSVFEKVKSYSSTKYLELLKEYRDKSKLLGNGTSVTEEEEGFTYLANINLKGFKYPEEFDDKNYYEENTLSKVIVYSQIGKGYDCK